MKLRILLMIAMAGIMLCGCSGDDETGSDAPSDTGISVVNDYPDDGKEWGDLVPVE